MSADDDQLRPLRERIDALDVKLLALLNERAQCALEVGKVKERQVLARSRDHGFTGPNALRKFYAA